MAADDLTTRDKLVAYVCHHAGVPAPGPRTGMEILTVLGAARAAHARLAGTPAGTAAEVYAEALEFVAGVWAAQQALVLGRLTDVVNGAGATKE